MILPHSMKTEISNRKRFKVAVIFINYGPYHFARLKAFQEICGQFQWSVIGIELASSQIEYPWKVRKEEQVDNFISVIDNQKFEEVTTFKLVGKVLSVLTKINPDALAIAGYSHPGMLAVLAWSMWNKKTAILMSESKEDDNKRYPILEKIKTFIISKYQAALVGGKPHYRYLAHLGMNTEGIFMGNNVIGNDDFHPNHTKNLSHPIQKPYFLAVNRFVSKKNLLNLILAYGLYRQASSGNTWDLVLSGDGELRADIEKKISDLGLQESVHLTGFLQQKELLPYFAHASCFIHASIQEQWGLVVNEAMAAGLPIIVSKHCGCVEDLVLEGVNGFSFDPSNQDQLVKLMLKMSTSQNIKNMGKASLDRIQHFSPDYFAKGLMEAINYALKVH
jgi:1,2-diacylglycerol 3-alpha-glucosyltransferase